MLELLRSLKMRWRPPFGKLSFSQCGEDAICAHLFDAVFRVERPTFLDIGGNHPIFMNNTYYFSRKGSRGVIVEPDPGLSNAFHRIRPEDTLIQAGVRGADTAKDQATLYVFDHSGLNTFVEEEAVANQRIGHKIVREVTVPLIQITELLSKHFSNAAPNLVSIDTEGLEEQILRAWDFEFRPTVFIVETLNYESQEKSVTIPRLMAQQGYMAYADTYINTIFVERQRFHDRSRA